MLDDWTPAVVRLAANPHIEENESTESNEEPCTQTSSQKAMRGVSFQQVNSAASFDELRFYHRLGSDCNRGQTSVNTGFRCVLSQKDAAKLDGTHKTAVRP